jgi:hypothetical protein
MVSGFIPHACFPAALDGVRKLEKRDRAGELKDCHPVASAQTVPKSVHFCPVLLPGIGSSQIGCDLISALT